MPAGTRVGGCHQGYAAWKNHGSIASSDAHDALFKRRAQRIQRVATVKGDLIKKEDPLMGQCSGMSPERLCIAAILTAQPVWTGLLTEPGASGRTYFFRQSQVIPYFSETLT